jgi:hypothetical protein
VALRASGKTTERNWRTSVCALGRTHLRAHGEPAAFISEPKPTRPKKHLSVLSTVLSFRAVVLSNDQQLIAAVGYC